MIYNPYKYREEPRTYQRKLREEEKKKKKNQKNPELRNLGSARPESCAAWVVRDLGSVLLGFFSPKSHATQAARCLGFFPLGHLILSQADGRESDPFNISRFFLPSDLIVVIVDFFFFFFFFFVFRLVREIEP